MPCHSDHPIPNPRFLFLPSFAKQFFKHLVAALTLSYTAVASSGNFTIAPFTNNIRYMFNVDGNQVDAYGSKISHFAGKYYLYGNAFADSRGDFGLGSTNSRAAISNLTHQLIS